MTGRRCPWANPGEPVLVRAVVTRPEDIPRTFAAARARLPGREGVLFVRRDNAASLRARTRMGMREVAGFAHGGAKTAVLAYVGCRRRARRSTASRATTGSRFARVNRWTFSFAILCATSTQGRKRAP